MINSKEIQDFIMKHWLLKHHCPFVCQNFSRQGFEEADVIVITKDLIVTEFEIKMSRSDYFADFKKEHKHRKLSGFFTSMHESTPNKFFYAVPWGLVKPEEVPEYAGLIYFKKFSLADQGKTFVEFEVMKKAPRIHKLKASNDLLLSIAKIHSARLVFGCALMTYRNKTSPSQYAETGTCSL